VHAGPPLDTSFDAFQIVERYERTAREHGGGPPEGYAALAAGAAAIRGALAGPEHDPVPCHNDLLPANFVQDGERLRIVDWEYAGMGDRYFDLGNLSVNCEFAEGDDERLLAAYWGEPCTPRRFAALRLMRIMSDFRESMWGAVQAVVSDLDFDFREYRDRHAARVRTALEDPRVPGWIEEAGAAG
jgi:thiamine kinase-like enzyme